MTIAIREARADDRADWSAFVASRPEGDILQDWAWGEAGAGERGEHWGRLIVVDAAGRTRGVAQVLDRSSMLGRTILYVPHGPLWDRESADAAVRPVPIAVRQLHDRVPDAAVGRCIGAERKIHAQARP